MSSDHTLPWPVVKIRDIKTDSEISVQTGPFGAQLHSKDYVEHGVPLLLIKNIKDGKVDYKGLPKITHKDALRLKKYQLQAGDLVFSRVGRVGSSFLATTAQNGWVISGQMLRFRPPSDVLDSKYTYYALSSEQTQKYALDASVGSTRQSINTSILEHLPLTLPPLPEQRRIAEILDTLDRTIEGTQRVIEKLQAARQGLLHDLLTRGLDEQNQLRDSERHPDQFHETELGRLPVGWEVAPLSSFAVPGVPHIKTGPFGSALKGEHWTEGGVPVITIGALGEGSFLLEELLYVSDKTAKRLNAYRVEPGHLVFSRVADVGRSVVVEKGESGWLMSSNLMRLSLDTHAVEPHYFQAVLSSSINLRAQIRRAVNAGGRDVANTAILNSLKLAWPTLDEQRRIVATIHGREARLRAETTTLVKLQALKRGLMDDLLTGRVRVPMAEVGA